MPDTVYKFSPSLRQRSPADCKGGDWFKVIQKGVMLPDFTSATDVEVDNDQTGLNCITSVGLEGRRRSPLRVPLRDGCCLVGGLLPCAT
jgi:hypothetical protein